MSSNPTVRDRIHPPLTAYRRRRTLWALTVLVGAFFFALGATTGDTRPADIGAMLAGLGLLGLICDRPHHTEHQTT